MANVDMGSLPSMTVVSNKFLETFYSSLAPLNAFSFDASDAIATEGSSVTVHTAPDTLTASTKECSGGYAVSDYSLTPVTVDLDKIDYVDVSICETDLLKSPVKNLEQVLVKPASRALAKKVLNKIYSKITAGNFSSSKTVAAASFAYSDVAALQGLVQTAGWSDASLIINGAATGSLLNSQAVWGSWNSTTGTQVSEGAITKMLGFQVFGDEYLGSVAGAAAWGAAVNPNAFVVAMRALPTDNGLGYGQVTNLRNEVGVNIRQTLYRDMSTGQVHIRWEVLAGAALGNTAGLIRIKAS